jgi:signal transduction histidine kinase
MNWHEGRTGVWITVADTGSGMTKAVLTKVFDAFYTTKGIGGTGLGLWVQ